MKQYETVIVSPPNLSETDLEALVTGVQTELGERFGGTSIVVTRWGKKTLAYPIKKFTEGYYVLYEYESDSEDCVAKVEARLRINENVMRYMTIRRDEERKSEARMKERFAKRKKHASDEGDSEIYGDDFEMEE